MKGELEGLGHTKDGRGLEKGDQWSKGKRIKIERKEDQGKNKKSGRTEEQGQEKIEKRKVMDGER